ncbi:UvrB/UvrC motif-containing protein [Aureliella helgolandensis]|uniref:UvrB/uvrC motif protein n=1 Tax=Aureliella helgolandensis TaxID=2527968 RepID=A0A518G0P6_9BACT|nr:UvrB/UvrC motif-containing protein [Aureliella helgolandensis]QDV22177.1 UvrB/uvrC motif protein [Aureliella helgolandensis]
MKCQQCEKPATFHITELTEPTGPVMVHLCEEHARTYLSQENSDSPTNALAGMLAKQLKLEQTADQLAKLDKKTCPVCGITFAEFRQAGRLGCAYDYVCFEDDLGALLLSIHGSKTHKGKRPARGTGSPDRQHKLIQLRREMHEAVTAEQYERAGELRDTIQDIENGGDLPGAPPSPDAAPDSDSDPNSGST